MQIEIVNVSVEDKGKYSMAVIAYRENGQLKEKKLMSFGAGASAFKVLSKAQAGQKFGISSVKNDKGYWDWTEASEGGTTSAATNESKGGSVSNPSPKSNYETAEERAMRQVLIVRQSSVSNAIEYLKTNPKKVPTVQEVLMVAKQIEDYVFGKNQQSEQQSAGGIVEMDSDVPL